VARNVMIFMRIK